MKSSTDINIIHDIIFMKYMKRCAILLNAIIDKIASKTVPEPDRVVLLFVKSNAEVLTIGDDLPRSCEKSCYFLYNIFANETQKEEYIDLYGRMKRCYWGFTMLSRIWRLKRSPVHNEHDLLMNDVNIADKSCLGIYQNGSIFIFTRRDIINFMNANLGHSNEFHSTPLPCKNPYNNVCFSKCELHNLYWFILSGSLKISPMIHAFYEARFDLDRFTKENEYMIREYTIKSFMKSASLDEKEDAILEMVCFYNSLSPTKYPYIHIHPLYPKAKLVDEMNDCLKMYLNSIYTLGNNRRVLIVEWINKLTFFHTSHPMYGRITTCHV